MDDTHVDTEFQKERRHVEFADTVVNMFSRFTEYTDTNADLNKARTVTVRLDGLKNISGAEGRVLAGKLKNSMNTFDKPNEVVEKKCKVEIAENTVTVKMPARSVVSLRIKK